jgi:hypothetical protein
MLKTALGTISAFLLSIPLLSAQPNAADSVIIESKTIAPASGPCQSVKLRVRVWITNQDSLANVTLPLQERSLSGNAYAILSRAASCSSSRTSAAVFDFLYPADPSGSPRLPTRVPSFIQYHSSPPDTFMFTGTFDPTDPGTLVPPNPARAALLEIKFDSVTTETVPGQFQLDSTLLPPANTIQFVNPRGGAIRVNFVKAVIQVGIPFQLALVAPAEAAFVLERRPTFVWNTLRDSAAVTAAYAVFVADNPAFAPADTSPPLTDTLWQIPFDLQFQTGYFWKVRAITARPDTVFSETRNFRVDAPPNMPLDLYPSSGSDISFNDFLVWLEGSDPDPGDSVTYQVQIDDNADFSSPEVDEGGIDGNTQPPPTQTFATTAAGNAIAIQLKTLTQSDNLKDDSLYYWRVRTVDNHGLGSGYTPGARNFFLNLADNSPNVPVPISPVDGAVLTVHRPGLTSASTSDPDPADPPPSLRYNFRLDTDGEVTADFLVSFTTAPGETTFTVADSLAENGQFFWAIRAIDSKGARSPFSAIREFFVNAQNEPPGAFALLAPPSGGFIVARTPTLDWEDAADPDPLDTVRYTVRLSSDSTFASGFTFGPFLASSHTVASGLLSRGVTYFWKVDAADNNAANTPGSGLFRFRILQLGDANKDGTLTASDVVLIINFAFLEEPPIDPPELADMNCDGMINSVDVVIALNVVFLGQSPPCDP